MLSVEQAQAALLKAAQAANSQAKIIKLPLAKALNKVLAADVVSTMAVPPFDNSAMDGFAVAFSDIENGALAISQTVFAGANPAALKARSAARIFTGAVIPENADTVVLQEDCSFDDEKVAFNTPEAIKKGQHIRRKGEDIQQGEPVLKKGQRLKASSIGLLASIGVAEVEVFAPLSLALISTGDELLTLGEHEPSAIEPGKIFNSNGPMLEALLAQAGFAVTAFKLRDDLAETEQLFADCAKQFDAIISIGGVSVGDADYVKRAIEKLGELELWKVAMKPGKPLSFGHIHDVPILGLPGNPVSAFTTMQLFALPFLLALQGDEQLLAAVNAVKKRYPVCLAKAMTPTRENFLRVALVECEGQWQLQPFSHQGSGVLSSVVHSSGFARIAKDQQTAPMALVEYWPFVFDGVF